MASQGLNVIEEFLVAVGFQLDLGVVRKLEGEIDRAIKSSETALGKLTLSVTAATTVFASGFIAATIGLERLAKTMQQSFYDSQKIGSSVAQINSFKYAASQLGSTAEKAQRSLDELGSLRRTNPAAYVGILKQMGVNARDAQGHIMGVAEALPKLQKSFQNSPYNVGLIRAQALGIDEDTFRAIRSGEFGRRQAEFDDIQKRVGFDPDKAAESGNRYAQAWQKMLAVTDTISKKIQSDFLERVQGTIDQVTRWMLDHSSDIVRSVENILSSLLGVVDGVGDLVKAFVQADPSTQNFILTVGALGAALLLLNSGPLGVLTALSGAILVLWEDYQKWRDGSKDTLIDWSKWEPGIKAALEAIKKLWEGFDALSKKLTGQDGLTSAFEILGGVLALKVLSPLLSIVEAITSLNLLKLPVWMLRVLGLATGTVGVAAGAALLGSTTGLNNGEPTVNPDGSLTFPDGSKRAGGFTHNGASLADRARAAVGRGVRSQPIPKGQAAENAKESYLFWRSKELTHDQAMAEVGNEQGESGFNPRAVGDGGSAHGIAQWHGDRRAKILAGIGIDVTTASHMDQLRAKYWEYTQGQERAAWNSLKSAKSMQEAVVAAVDGERPRDRLGAIATRIGMARGLDSTMRGLGGGGTGSGQAPGATPEQASSYRVSHSESSPPSGAHSPYGTLGDVGKVNSKGNSYLTVDGQHYQNSVPSYMKFPKTLDYGSVSKMNSGGTVVNSVNQENHISAVGTPDQMAQSLRRTASRGIPDDLRNRQGSSQ